MDVDDMIILSLTVWVVVCTVLVETLDVYVTLLLIGLLIVMEVGGVFIRPEVRDRLKPAVYFLLFAFATIVVRKIMEVLK